MHRVIVILNLATALAAAGCSVPGVGATEPPASADRLASPVALTLSQVLHPATFHGVFVGRVLESFVREGERAGVYVRVQLEEQLVHGAPVDESEGATQWAVGDTRLAYVRPSAPDGVCGDGRAVARDERVLVFPDLNTGEWLMEDGEPARNAGVFGSLFCIDADGTVHIKAGTPVGFLAERGAVGLDAIRRVVAGFLPLEPWKQAVQEKCGRLACPEATMCFFGEECVSSLALRPVPAHYLGQFGDFFYPDGSLFSEETGRP